MEINKIISNLNILGINNVSETSKKGEVIKAETTNSNVQEVDDDSQLQTDAEKKPEVTYLVIGRDGCGACSYYYRIAKQLADTSANFKVEEIDMGNGLGVEYALNQVGSSRGGQLPYVIKRVDGKLVERVPIDSFEQEDIAKTLTKGLTEMTSIKEDQKYYNASYGNTKPLIDSLDGTTYVVFNNGAAMDAYTEIYKNREKLGEHCNIISTNMQNETFLSEMGINQEISGKYIAKFLDGKFVEFIPLDDVSPKDITNILISKSEESKKINTTKEAETIEETTTKEAELADDKKSESNEQLVLKQKLDSLKQNLEVMNEVRKEITTDALENAISNATSISDLKDVISIYSSSLDFELQINLSSVVNEFNSDDDVDSAKEQLLEML